MSIIRTIETDYENILSNFVYPNEESELSGIVITVVNMTELLNAYINLKYMRINLKSDIHVEIFYSNKIKSTILLELEKELSPIRFINIYDVPKIKNYFKKDKYDGFQIKPFALLASSFEKLLLLDANNTLLTDPQNLFEYDEYKKYGAVFWPDYSRENTIHELYKLFKVKDKSYEFQYGQMIINRKTKFDEILFICMVNSSKYRSYFFENMLPQDTFRFGFNYVNKLKNRQNATYYLHLNEPSNLTEPWFKINDFKLYDIKGFIQKNKHEEELFLHHFNSEWKIYSRKEKKLYLRYGPNVYKPSELYENYFLHANKYYDVFKRKYLRNALNKYILKMYLNNTRFILHKYLHRCIDSIYYNYCHSFLRKPPEIKELFDDNSNEKIDVVYKYVNLNAEGYKESLLEYGENKDDLNPERYRDLIKVLKYSISSVKKNFRNLGNIYVVVCDRTHIELSDIDIKDIKIILHKDFIENCYLPTFNSETITCNFNNIKEITNEFILMDDDFFIGSPVNLTYFKQQNKYVHYVSNSRLVKHVNKNPITGWEKICKLTYEKCMKYFNHEPFLIEHAPIIINKQLMNKLNSDYIAEITDTNKSKFRSSTSLNYELFYTNWIYHNKKSITKTEYCDLIQISSKYDILNFLAKIDALLFFNINDDLGKNIDLKIIFALEDILDNKFKHIYSARYERVCKNIVTHF